MSKNNQSYQKQVEADKKHKTTKENNPEDSDSPFLRFVNNVFTEPLDKEKKKSMYRVFTSTFHNYDQKNNFTDSYQAVKNLQLYNDDKLPKIPNEKDQNPWVMFLDDRYNQITAVSKFKEYQQKCQKWLEDLGKPKPPGEPKKPEEGNVAQKKEDVTKTEKLLQQLLQAIDEGSATYRYREQLAQEANRYANEGFEGRIEALLANRDDQAALTEIRKERKAILETLKNLENTNSAYVKGDMPNYRAALAKLDKWERDITGIRPEHRVASMIRSQSEEMIRKEGSEYDFTGLPENSDYRKHPRFAPIIQAQEEKKSNERMIRIGQELEDYNNNFHKEVLALIENMRAGLDINDVDKAVDLINELRARNNFYVNNANPKDVNLKDFQTNVAADIKRLKDFIKTCFQALGENIVSSNAQMLQTPLKIQQLIEMIMKEWHRLTDNLNITPIDKQLYLNSYISGAESIAPQQLKELRKKANMLPADQFQQHADEAAAKALKSSWKAGWTIPYWAHQFYAWVTNMYADETDMSMYYSSTADLDPLDEMLVDYVRTFLKWVMADDDEHSYNDYLSCMDANPPQAEIYLTHDSNVYRRWSTPRARARYKELLDALHDLFREATDIGRSTRNAISEFYNYSKDKNAPVIYQAFMDSILFQKMFRLGYSTIQILNYVDDWDWYGYGDSIFNGSLCAFARMLIQMQPGVTKGKFTWPFLRNWLDERLINVDTKTNRDRWQEAHYVYKQAQCLGSFTRFLFMNLLTLKHIVVDKKTNIIIFDKTQLFRNDDNGLTDTNKHITVLLYLATMTSKNPLFDYETAKFAADNMKTEDRKELFTNFYEHMFKFVIPDLNASIDSSSGPGDGPKPPPSPPSPGFGDETPPVDPGPDDFSDSSNESYYSSSYNDSDDDDSKKEQTASLEQ